jgi:hypothetical protein
MNKKIKISVGALIVVGIALFLGYLWGRSSVELPAPEIKEVVKWEKEPYAVHDTIDRPVPYRVEVPVDRPVPVPTDTAALFAVWCDYYLKREYKLDFSNDTLGTFIADVSIQENKLLSATSTVQPIRKVITRTETIYKVPKLQPWLMFGTSPKLDAQKIQFGLDIQNKYIIGVSGLRIRDEYGYTFDLGIKF